MKTLQFCNTIFLFALLSPVLFAQPELTPLTTSKKENVVSNISDLLMENYVFPQKAEEMSSFLKQRLGDGHYKSDDPFEFSNLLTQDLQSISEDLHIRVRFEPEMISEMTQIYTTEDTVNYQEMQDERAARDNFGFKEVKMLSSGVGYLKLDGFSGSRKAGETAAAAMNFLSSSKALIIDLRQNGGGSPDMIQFLSTYFFDQDLVHLNSFYYRPQDETTQRWTLPYVPGKRLDKADVYILTSGNTFSAAEEFSYNLRNLKRATLVGETTGGGAHPGGMMPASDGFAIFVPNGRAINPITGTNWEGTGVKPHIETPANNALTEAHMMAVQKLDEKFRDAPDNPYEWTSTRLKALAHPYHMETSELDQFIGDFGPRRIVALNGRLFYQREQGPKVELICMQEDLFMMEDIPYFRLKFIREDGKVVAVEGIYENGHRDKNMKVISP